MKFIYIFVWGLFVLYLVFSLVQGRHIQSHGDKLDIISLEFADKNEGAAILEDWYANKVDTKNLLSHARTNTIADFLFIIGYVGVLIIISNYIMQRQRKLVLNEMLRACFVLALLAGLLDLVENFILLYNMHHYVPGSEYISTKFISYTKFGCIGMILLAWLFGLAGALFGKTPARNRS